MGRFNLSMLAALCTAIPARAGLLVIGGEGALVMGGVATVLVGVHLADTPFVVGVAVMAFTGALAGGAWIGAAGKNTTEERDDHD